MNIEKEKDPVFIVKSKYPEELRKLVPEGGLKKSGFKAFKDLDVLAWTNGKGDQIDYLSMSFERDVMYVTFFEDHDEKGELTLASGGEIIEDSVYVEENEGTPQLCGNMFSEKRLCSLNEKFVNLYIDDVEKLYYKNGKPAKSQPTLKFSTKSLSDLFDEVLLSNGISVRDLEEEFRKEIKTQKRQKKKLDEDDILYDKMHYYIDGDSFYLSKLGVLIYAELSSLMESEGKINEKMFRVCAYRIPWNNGKDDSICHSPHGLVHIMQTRGNLVVHDIKSGQLLLKLKTKYIGHRIDSIDTVKTEDGWAIYMLDEGDYESFSMIMMK